MEPQSVYVLKYTRTWFKQGYDTSTDVYVCSDCETADKKELKLMEKILKKRHIEWPSDEDETDDWPERPAYGTEEYHKYCSTISDMFSDYQDSLGDDETLSVEIEIYRDKIRHTKFI